MTLVPFPCSTPQLRVFFQKERALPSPLVFEGTVLLKGGAEQFSFWRPIARGLFQKIVRHLDEVVLNAESPSEAEINFLRRRELSFIA